MTTSVGKHVLIVKEMKMRDFVHILQLQETLKGIFATVPSGFINRCNLPTTSVTSQFFFVSFAFLEPFLEKKCHKAIVFCIQ